MAQWFDDLLRPVQSAVGWDTSKNATENITGGASDVANNIIGSAGQMVNELTNVDTWTSTLTDPNTWLDTLTPIQVKQDEKLQDAATTWAEENKDSNPVAAAYDTAQDKLNEVKDAAESVVNKVTQTVTDLGSGFIDTLKKYWYVPVIVGGVIVGYKLIGRNSTTKLLAAIAAKNN